MHRDLIAIYTKGVKLTAFLSSVVGDHGVSTRRQCQITIEVITSYKQPHQLWLRTTMHNTTYQSLGLPANMIGLMLPAGAIVILIPHKSLNVINTITEKETS